MATPFTPDKGMFMLIPAGGGGFGGLDNFLPRFKSTPFECQ
jgi:hypothetical protein